MNVMRLGKSKKIFNVSFLFIFLLITLFINFFHTETTLIGDDDCPACHFLNSTFNTNHINFFYLPQLAFIEMLKTVDISLCYQLFVIDPTSRSPPKI